MSKTIRQVVSELSKDISFLELVNENDKLKYQIKQLESALREIVLNAKPKYRSSRDKTVRDGICLSGSLLHYESMPHVIHAGKNLILQQEKNDA